MKAYIHEWKTLSRVSMVYKESVVYPLEVERKEEFRESGYVRLTFREARSLYLFLRDVMEKLKEEKHNGRNQ